MGKWRFGGMTSTQHVQHVYFVVGSALQSLTLQIVNGIADLLIYNFYHFPSWLTQLRPRYSNSRLFTSGTDEHGKPFIVEWRVRNGERKVKRAFRGLHGCSGMLHFDLNKNCILAAGYNHQIRFWDINNGSLLGVSIADGNLPVSLFSEKINFLIYQQLIFVEFITWFLCICILLFFALQGCSFDQVQPGWKSFGCDDKE